MFGIDGLVTTMGQYYQGEHESERVKSLSTVRLTFGTSNWMAIVAHEMFQIIVFDHFEQDKYRYFRIS